MRLCHSSDKVLFYRGMEDFKMLSVEVRKYFLGSDSWFEMVDLERNLQNAQKQIHFMVI